MLIEDPRLRSRLAEGEIAGATVGLMATADRDMRSALRGVDDKWALEFSWEFAQAVAQMVEVAELESCVRQQRLKLIEHVSETLSKLPDRRARRRALRLLKRLERDAGVVAGHAVRPQVALRM